MTATKRLLAALLLVAVAIPAHADFHSIARAIGSQRGVNRVWIPFLGIARVFVRVAEPNGVSDFQLATFEGTGNLDRRQLQKIMRERVGPGFTPLVQAWSRKKGEWSYIYAKPVPGSNRIELIILAHDDEETVLVRVDVDADIIAREVQLQPRGVTRVAGR